MSRTEGHGGRREQPALADQLAALMSQPQHGVDFWDRPDGDWGSMEADGMTASARRETLAHANSCYRLGSKALRRGDLEAATNWLSEAAERGHPGAMFRLAVAVHRVGASGVKGDVRYLVEQAAQLGHGDARVLLDLADGRPASRALSEDAEFADEVQLALLQVVVPRPRENAPGRSERFSTSPLRAPELTVAARQVPGRGPAPGQWKAVEGALRILHVLHGSSVALSAAQLAKRTSLPKKVLERLLHWLCQCGMAAGLPDGGFTSGPQLQTLAQPPGRSAEAALQHRLAALRDAVGAAVYVSSYTDGEIHISRFADGPQAPRVYEWVDFRAAAHASAVGKSLLAQLPFEQRMDHLSRHRAARLTSRTITDPRRLFADIDERGPRAPQFDRQEYSTGEVCVAIPLNLGNQADALALSMPASQQHRLEEAAQILSDQSTVVLLSLLLAGDPPVEPTSAPGQQIIVVPPHDVLRQPSEPITVLTRPAPPPLQAAPEPLENALPGTNGAVTPGTQVVAWDDVVAGREEHVVTMEPLGAYAAAP